MASQDPRAGRGLSHLPTLRPASPPGRAPRPAGRTDAARPSRPGPPLLPLLAWPVLLSFGVTLLRLVGELRGWAPAYFSRVPGGGLSPLGIVWLVPFVGFFFGWRLQRAGLEPPAPARAVGLPAAALVGVPAAAYALGRALETGWTGNLTLWGVASGVALALAVAGWPALGWRLLVYAAVARAFVAAVMGLAVARDWGTHYDVPPPGFLAMPQLKRWLWIGLLPQATIWVAFTVAVGGLCGYLGWLASGRARRARSIRTL